MTVLLLATWRSSDVPHVFSEVDTASLGVYLLTLLTFSYTHSQ